VISAKTPQTTPQNKDLPPLDHCILSTLGKVEAAQAKAEQVEKETDCTAQIHCLLNLKSTQKRLIQCYQDMGVDKETFTVLLLDSIALYQPSETVKVSDFYHITSRRKVTMLMAFLTMLGLLLNDAGNNYHWASTKQLKKLTNPTAQLCNKLFGNNVVDLLNKQLNQARLNRAKRDPYTKINGNEITPIRKEFTGPLTDAEKAAIRQHNEEQAFDKLASESGISLEAKQAITAIKDKALVEQANREAQWTETSDKLIQYTKVLVILGLVIFVITILNKGTSSHSDTSYETNISIMEAAQ